MKKSKHGRHENQTNFNTGEKWTAAQAARNHDKKETTHARIPILGIGAGEFLHVQILC